MKVNQTALYRYGDAARRIHEKFPARSRTGEKTCVLSDRLPLAENGTTEEKDGKEVHEPGCGDKEIPVLPVTTRRFIDDDVLQELYPPQTLEATEEVVVLTSSNARRVAAHPAENLTGHDITKKTILQDLAASIFLPGVEI